MVDQENPKPDSTAVRVALWRAMHVQFDASPHIFTDEIGLKLANPDSGWQERPDMDLQRTSGFRASIVSRARFVEDLVLEQIPLGLQQYAILGAGLDTFVQRQPDIASKLTVFEIDQPNHQLWKQKRLKELGFGLPENLRFVPVNFETDSWWKRLLESGFDINKKSLISSLGVSMYISKEATLETLKSVAGLKDGSQLVMTYMLPIEMIEQEDQQAMEFSLKGAASSGTPFISFYTPDEIKDLALKAGFNKVTTVSTIDLRKRYFLNRKDSLRLASGEEILVAYS